MMNFGKHKQRLNRIQTVKLQFFISAYKVHVFPTRGRNPRKYDQAVISTSTAFIIEVFITHSSIVISLHPYMGVLKIIIDLT